MTLGLKIDERDNGCCYLCHLGHKFSFAAIKCKNLQFTIDYLKKHKVRGQVYACLDKNDNNLFAANAKSLEASFAILYDFVDAFVISSFDDLSTDIDPIVNLRIFNDSYKPIYLQVPDDTIYDDLDEIIAYCKLSNIDGLVLSNSRLIKYASEKSGDILQIVADGVDSPEVLSELELYGVRNVMFKTGRFPCLKSLLLALGL